jgi:hypothetical protein
MKKEIDYFKKAPGKYFLVVLLCMLWLFITNFVAHLMSIELDGGLQAAATFVYIVYSYYTVYFSIKLLKLKS